MESLQTSRGGTRRLIGIAAALALSACSSPADPAHLSTATADVRPTLVVAAETGLPTDPLTIDSVRVVGDTLVATVTHGGGCAAHTYQLVIGSAWMESFPVQVGARIAHNANGDACKALMRRNLRMSLRPLADAYRAAYRQDHGTIVIGLSGASANLLYQF